MAKNLLQYNAVTERAELFDIKGSAFLIFDRSARRYFSGVDIAEGALLVCDNATYFADDRYFFALAQKLKDTRFTAERFLGTESVIAVIKKLKIKKVYTDLAKISVSEFNEYKKLGVKLLNGGKLINSAIAVKSQKEIEYISKSCKIAEKAFYKTLDSIKLGVTENEIKDILESNMLFLGAEGVAFDTIVAFGANSAVPHHETGNTKLKNDTPVLIDFGAKYKGYSSDMTRTIFFGKPSKKFITAYDAVKNANEKAIQLIADNFSAKAAHEIAEGVLKESGFDKYFTHSLGHGLGLEIHENPRLSKKSDEILKANSVFTIEPGVYFDGEFGIRIEDTVLLNSGIKRLFTDGKELIVIK